MDKRVSLDTSVFREIVGSDLAPVRSWLRAHRLRVVVSDAVLGEAIGERDAAARRRLFECILDLRNDWTVDPPGWPMAREAIQLVRKSRGDWIDGNARSVFLRKQRRWRATTLSELTRGKRWYEVWHERHSEEFSGYAAGIQDWQKRSRDRLAVRSYRSNMREAFPDVHIPETLDDPELSWRLLAAERLGLVTNGQVKERVNYFVDIRAGIPMRDWASLWLYEASANEQPATAVHGMVRYHQLQKTLRGRGNMVDALMAVEALRTDVFVTGDKRLVEVLERVAPRVGDVMPRLIRIEPGQSLPEALSDV